jgi:ribose transport system permease protein
MSTATASGGPLPQPSGWMGRIRFQRRFVAIWAAFAVLIVISAVVVPRSLLPSTTLQVIPLAAFLAIAAMGQTLVFMARGIDLSVPAIITLSSTVLLGVSGGSDGNLAQAVIAALLISAAVGLCNGILVGVLQLNALIVTLAVGAVVSGLTLSYRMGLPQEARVPPILADFGGTRWLGINLAVWVAVVLILLATLILRRTRFGRRFSAVGANPRAARVAGVNVAAYQTAAFAVGGLLYGFAGILISAFIRNPTLNVGDPYLLAPIAAAVLAGTAISGGVGSMISVAGAALFLTHLGQVLKMMGISTAVQMIIQGIAIALGMGLARVQMPKWFAKADRVPPRGK